MRASARPSGGSPRSRRRPSRGPGRCRRVADEERAQFLAPLPLTLLPLERDRYEELEELGVRKAGTACRAPGRRRRRTFGAGRPARLEPGEGRERPRACAAAARPPSSSTSLEFPEAVGNELTLRRALAGLVDQAARAAGAARPLRPQGRARRAARERRLVAADVDAARADRRSRPDSRRARAAARRPALAGRRAAARARRADRAAGQQLELLAAGGEDRAGCSEGLRQVRASTGSGSVCTVVEVAPWSRIPESRALLVPKDE